ncbi:MAG TPA: cytochrome c [Candidatus Angelobacter sp.]
MTRTSFFCIVTIAFMLMMVAQPAFSQSGGEALYKQKCQVCHAPDGSGDTIMGKKLGAKDLKSAEIQKLTDAEITNVITKGKDKMKGFEGKLSNDEIKSLVTYVRELAKKK